MGDGLFIYLDGLFIYVWRDINNLIYFCMIESKRQKQSIKFLMLVVNINQFIYCNQTSYICFIIDVYAIKNKTRTKSDHLLRKFKKDKKHDFFEIQRI